MSEVLAQALEALESSAAHLSAVDVSNAEANCAEVRYRPLTQKVIDAAQALRQEMNSTPGNPAEMQNHQMMVMPVNKYECRACEYQWSQAGAPTRCPGCGYAPILGSFQIVESNEGVIA